MLNQRDVAYVTKALALLPRRVGLLHLRKALSAWGGQVKNTASSLAPRATGTLSKSIGVAVKIPDASYDVKHHGKPARVIVGPKRRFGRIATQKELKSGRLGKRRIKSGRYTFKAIQGAKVFSYIPASRYAHFDKRYMVAAGQVGAMQAQTTIMQKLTQGVAQEAAKLYAAQSK
jgi:hypothetical protein